MDKRIETAAVEMLKTDLIVKPQYAHNDQEAFMLMRARSLARIAIEAADAVLVENEGVE
jgi:hypothetical protein